MPFCWILSFIVSDKKQAIFKIFVFPVGDYLTILKIFLDLFLVSAMCLGVVLFVSLLLEVC